VSFSAVVRGTRFPFADLRELMAKANERKSGDDLVGLSASSDRERVAAKLALADVRISDLVDLPLVDDDITAAVLGGLDRDRFAKLLGWQTVGEFRDSLLEPGFAAAWQRDGLAKLITPELAAATAKLCSNLDLVAAAAPLLTVTRCRNTVGEIGVLAGRIQPNHPRDDPMAIVASTLDGLMHGCGDAVIGVNPAIDSVDQTVTLLHTLSSLIDDLELPTQACVLAHVTAQMAAMERGAPVDLVFQSVAGTERANASFGISLELLREAREAALAQHASNPDRYVGNHVMYFETGQGSALSADSHEGVDQLTCEARAQAVARMFDPFLVNSVVGFIGPEYLADSVQITRAGLEDHFMGKLMGLPMGCDVCYTNHVDADQNSNDNLLMLLGAAGCNFVMGVPAGDDVMLGYQTTSYHDLATTRRVLGMRPAPEFERWLIDRGLWRDGMPARAALELMP
jgi:ethanolamine ammonia-lyase large subunit